MNNAKAEGNDENKERTNKRRSANRGSAKEDDSAAPKKMTKVEKRKIEKMERQKAKEELRKSKDEEKLKKVHKMPNVAQAQKPNSIPSDDRNAASNNAIYTPDSKSSPFLYNQLNNQINDIIIDTHDPLNDRHYQTLMTSHLNPSVIRKSKDLENKGGKSE